ncbi:MAG: glycosyltransferase [Lachnospiraceae bacterium]|nr:glycosyltransferase [Lachnospiraceae bacterium]
MSEIKSLYVEMVIPQLAEKGGLDRIINDLAEHLSHKADLEFHVVQLVDTGLKWWNDHALPTNLFKAQDDPSFMDTAHAYAAYLQGLERAPDVIMATGWPITVTIAREAIRQAGIRTVLVAYPHMTLQEGEEKGVGGVACIKDADVAFAISPQVETEIRNGGLSLRTLRVNNGIRMPKSLTDRGKPGCTHKLLYVGRLVEGKNLPMVFRAMAYTKEPWSLQIAGQGELEKTKEQAAIFGVSDRVEFCGFLNDPYADAEEISFVIMPSNYEGFCMVIPEALSRGIPVITTPVGCATEVIKPGENGYLVNIDDATMLSQILDMIAEEKLPIPDPTVCRASVDAYELRHAMEHIYNELLKLGKEGG